jgi:small subunit ribosomal protein S19
MARSSRKGPHVDQRLLKRVGAMIESGGKKILKTWSRDCAIPPEFVGFTFAVHNGKDFIPVYVTEQMVGHKLGEFSHTRKFRVHGGKMAQAQEKAEVAATATAAASVQQQGKAPATKGDVPEKK